MKTIKAWWLGAAVTMGAGIGCAALIGLEPADPPPACTDPADQTALGKATFVADVLGCTLKSSGDVGGASACIQAKDGLSQTCSDCAAANGACILQQCNTPCGDGAGTAACQACIAAKCSPTFLSCAGTPLYACIGASDATALTKHMGSLETDLKTCGRQNTTDPNAVVACIQHTDDLSQPCAVCFAQQELCAVTECSACVNDPTSTMCPSCVDSTCGPVFALCSGIPSDGGAPD